MVKTLYIKRSLTIKENNLNNIEKPKKLKGHRPDATSLRVTLKNTVYTKKIERVKISDGQSCDSLFFLSTPEFMFQSPTSSEQLAEREWKKTPSAHSITTGSGRLDRRFLKWVPWRNHWGSVNICQRLIVFINDVHESDSFKTWNCFDHQPSEAF